MNKIAIVTTILVMATGILATFTLNGAITLRVCVNGSSEEADFDSR